MKKKLFAGMLSSLAVFALATTGRADEGKSGSITGELIDTACYLKMNAHGADHQKCATKCAKSGIPVGVLDEKSGKVYTLAVPSSTFAAVMAKTARVSGDVFEDSHAILPMKVEVKEANGTWTEVKLPAMQ